MLVSNTWTKPQQNFNRALCINVTAKSYEGGFLKVNELTHVPCPAAPVRSVCSLSHHSAVRHTPQHVYGC